ncbi:MAG: glycosyltransferase family 4 protein [Saprospiraceae bacterium]|nr:glycosyltransferase family 4 protein [Saprospiraceae bacterium]
MKIVVISRWYSEKMGYIENCLPRALAELGHEVHVVTSTAQVYFNHPFYEKSYQNYLGDRIQPVGSSDNEGGVRLHRLPFWSAAGHIWLRGLTKKIKELQPDIVHTFEHTSPDSVRLALVKKVGSGQFKLFTANHSVYSVLDTARNWETISIFKKISWHLLQRVPGGFVASQIERCFAVTSDAGEIAARFLGVPAEKVKVTTLGVDTVQFHPDSSAQQTTRDTLGFTEQDIVVLYTGRLTAQKNPLLVAKAIEQLNKNAQSPSSMHTKVRFKGLFIGDGEQKEAIAALPNIVILPPQPYRELPKFYQAADIAVWAMEESTSQLDAVGSGVCLVLTDKITAYACIESADDSSKPKIVSRKFKHQNFDDLVTQLISLTDPSVRAALQTRGVATIEGTSSWKVIAKERVKDYE